MQNLFSEAIEKELLKYTAIQKSNDFCGNIEVTTFIGKNFIIDVLEEECCLTAKGINEVYSFNSDDYLDVIDEIMEEIKEITLGG